VLTAESDKVYRSPHGWQIGRHPELTPELLQELEEGLVARLPTCFASTLDELEGYRGLDGPLQIPMLHDKPVFQTPRKYSPVECEIRDEKCRELLQADRIERAAPTCQYASRPTMPVKKNADGQWTDRRFCNDYRAVNAASIPDRYALHNADEFLQMVAGGRYHSKCDLRQAFLQVPIDPADRPKTAFWWNNELWQYKYMPYGLVSGSAKFQRVMDVELAAAGLADHAKAFVDDVAAWNAEGGPKAHIALIFRLLDALAGCGLRCHPAKCQFFMPEMELLGHKVSPGAIAPHESKLAAIEALTSPTSLSELRSKLAFLNYYRSYIPHFATIAAPLNELLRAGVPWQWGPAQEHAFSELKRIVCTPGVLLRPFDPSRKTMLYTDWSKRGIGAVLHQVGDDGREYLVACMSRSLNKAERGYGSYAGECLGAVWGVKSFRQYLHGVHFVLYTDHQPLKWLMANQELTGKYSRWALIMQEYSFTVEHRAGRLHDNADVLSRYPLMGAEDRTGACLDPVQSPAACLAAFPSPLCCEIEVPSCWYSSDLDGHLPVPADELLQLPPASVGEDCPLQAAAQAASLAAVAERWVSGVWPDLVGCGWSEQPLRCGPGPADDFGVWPVDGLCTRPVGAAFAHAAQQDGIVLYEPFGGLCAGLDMLLSCGVAVCQYYYSDVDLAAQAVARNRVAGFHAKYPHLFPTDASVGAFELLPMDVRDVDSASLVEAGALDGRQWLVVAGWSCEDLSPAGKGRGLEGDRSSNFFDAVRIVGTLQQLQGRRPPAYVMENTAMQVQFGHAAVRERDFPWICEILGDPVLLDAAQVGAYAHRLRNYWSNLAPPEHVSLVLARASRVPGRLVDDVLDPGRQAQLVLKLHPPPFYQCNAVGEPPCVLPTLVAFPSSRAFRAGQPGMVWDAQLGRLCEPNPDERERMMGYPAGCTRAEGVSLLQRHAITGRAMDRHAMVHLMAVYLCLGGYHRELWERRLPLGQQLPGLEERARYSPQAVAMMEAQGWRWGMPLHSTATSDPIVEPISLRANVGTRGLGYEGVWVHDAGGGSALLTADWSLGQATTAVDELSSQLSELALASRAASECECVGLAQVYSESELHQHYCAVAAVAEGQEAVEEPVASRGDPYADEGLMFFLMHGKLPTGAEHKEVARIRRRAGRYSMVEGQLRRVMADGSSRQVPPADKRVELVRETHERTGHFGVKRTKHLLMASFWWPGMEADVVKVLATCEPCARIKASFNAERPQLQPLPIEGLFYRWGVDMAGPFAESADGNTHVLIMIEGLSKMIEVVAVKGKLARNNAYAFLSCVLARYGACAEVLSDRGTEFEGAFHQLLVDSFIDHRTTSPNHPQANGLAERAVQTMKKALAKYVAQHKQLGDWDWKLHRVAMGYRCSKQAATGLSPYEILFGTQPIIPPAIRERVEEPRLDFVDQEQCAEYILQRAALFERHTAIAMSNQRIAQHRDTLRYQQVRSGMYMPVTVRFEPGDYVYVRRRTVVNSLQSEAKPGIYRVVEVLPSGVVSLQGRCGTTMKVNVAECAPCHLSNINPALDPQLQRVDEDFPCSVCGSPEDEEVMLICDGCFRGHHIYCLQPPLASVPTEEVWLCDECKQQGLNVQDLAVLRQQNLPVAESDAPLFPSVQQRAHDAAAQQLHGKLCWLPGSGAGDPWVQGKLEYVARMERKEHSRSPLRWVSEGRPPVYLSLRKAERMVKAGPPAAVAGQGAGAQLSSQLAEVFTAERQVAAPVTAQPKVPPASWDEAQVAAAVQAWCGAEADQAMVASCLGVIEQLAQQDAGQELGFAEDPVWVLVWAVDLRVCDKLAVAGGSSAAVATVMLERYKKGLWELDKQPGKLLDQLTAGWYKKAHVRKPLDWVFLCPPVGLVELAVGLAVQQARKGVAVLVQRSMLTNRSRVWAVMLREWVQQSRLVCITSDGSEVAWLVVFATQQLEQQMVSLRGKIHRSGWVLSGLQ